MSLFPQWMPIAKQKPLVRGAWVSIAIAALASYGLFIHLHLAGEVDRNTLIMFGIGMAGWIAFGTMPFLGRAWKGRSSSGDNFPRRF
ncbi:MAG: hypothetical protein ACYTFG_00610 [Planctomycetota bacterium]|jgi:hypothetical protein